MPLRSVLILLLLAAVPAAAAERAPAEPARGVFCSVLDQALEAAEEKPEPFASVHMNMTSAPDASRLSVPGFQGRPCHLTYADEASSRVLECSQTLAPPELTVANLAADTARCLGLPAPAPVRKPGSGEERRFDLGRVKILIEGSCTDECQVGRRVSYRIEAPRG